MSLVIGTETSTAPCVPSIHPAVLSAFQDDFDATAPIELFPVGLDVKQSEAARTLLIDREQTRFCPGWHPGAIPIFLSTHPDVEQLFCRLLPRVSIILDLHDKGTRLDFLSLTDAMCQAIRRHHLQVIYLKLQVHDPAKYRQLNMLPDQVHLLSWPLLPGGSRFHITVQEDYLGDHLFSRRLCRQNAPDYRYDWSCIGAPTSDDRKAAFAVLEKADASRAFFTVSRPGHTDASVATVPVDEYLRISQQSRLCISLNGRGPWCLKDGELLASGCFILRQWHPVLELNPFSPRDGVHWRVFKTDRLLETIEDCLGDDSQRECIRRRGHEMFRGALRHNAWSQRYAACLRQFLLNPDKRAWGGLAFA